MTFGTQIRQFAQSLDSINENQLADVCRIVEGYTRQTLGIDSTKVYLETPGSGGRPALVRKRLPDMQIEHIEEIKDARQAFRSQAALSYARKKPLWIVSKGAEANLESTSQYADLWSKLRTIPAYRSHKEAIDDEDPVKTSIHVPLRLRASRRIFGVVNFRTHHFLQITEEAKRELERIAEAISYVLRTFETSRSLDTGTSRAIASMEERLQEPLPSLTKPLVFLASSSRADAEVISSIETVLKAHANTVDYEFWSRMDAPGNIMLQLMEVIGRCRYGIAYLSEKTENGFADNFNVVFEAGMFHGRASRYAGTASPWIAIREVTTDAEPFFDIRQERILGVPRDKEGKLLTAKFEKALGSRLRAMIASSHT